MHTNHKFFKKAFLKPTLDYWPTWQIPWPSLVSSECSAAGTGLCFQRLPVWLELESTGRRHHTHLFLVSSLLEEQPEISLLIAVFTHYFEIDFCCTYGFLTNQSYACVVACYEINVKLFRKFQEKNRLPLQDQLCVPPEIPCSQCN